MSYLKKTVSESSLKGLVVASIVTVAALGSSWPAQAQSTQASRAQPSSAGPASAKAPAPKASAKKTSVKKASAKPKRKTASAGQKRKVAQSAQARQISVGSKLGLRTQMSEIALNSSAVLVMDQRSRNVLLEKNPDVALPIASITKLMTALVVLDHGLSMSESIEITREDTQLEKYSASRLRVGNEFSRGELMHLALMSSENRAAHALGRTFPGGMPAFVEAMNQKAAELGMKSSRFVEPTGLSSNNVSSPRDLVQLVNAAYEFPLIREYSTAPAAVVQVGERQQHFRNTNALARGEAWELGLSKTGFIRDAGRCLVMQARIDGRPVIMVMLDAQASSKRLLDAERIRRWLENDQVPQAVRS